MTDIIFLGASRIFRRFKIWKWLISERISLFQPDGIERHIYGNPMTDLTILPAKIYALLRHRNTKWEFTQRRSMVPSLAMIHAEAAVSAANQHIVNMVWLMETQTTY